MNISLMRNILRAGSLVFGGSALFLLILPGTFLGLLNFDKSDALSWSMRMIGITVFALAGNMWNNANQSSEHRVSNVAKIMCVSAAGLGVLTLMIPAHLGWFTYVYAAIGFGFSLAYLTALLKK
jgi:O-antigen/teichoic acid export membrane protein